MSQSQGEAPINPAYRGADGNPLSGAGLAGFDANGVGIPVQLGEGLDLVDGELVLEPVEGGLPLGSAGSLLVYTGPSTVAPTAEDWNVFKTHMRGVNQVPSLEGLAGWTIPTGAAWVVAAEGVNVGPRGIGVVTIPSTGGDLLSSAAQRLVVDSSRAYDFSVPIFGNGAGSCTVGLRCYDAEGRIIGSQHVNSNASTITTLAAALNPGDTTIVLTSATGWQNAVATGQFIGFAGFTSGGVLQPAGGYTRLVGNSANHAAASSGATPDWSVGGISGNTITLRVPWAGPAYAAGTQVANYGLGQSWAYPLGATTTNPTGWEIKRGIFGAAPTTGLVPGRFWPGTASATVRIFFASLTAEVRVGQPLLNMARVLAPGSAAVVQVPAVPTTGAPLGNTGWYWDETDAAKPGLSFSYLGSRIFRVGAAFAHFGLTASSRVRTNAAQEFSTVSKHSAEAYDNVAASIGFRYADRTYCNGGEADPVGWRRVGYAPENGTTVSNFVIVGFAVEGLAGSTTHAMTAKLQKSSDGGATWSDVTDVTVTLASGTSGRRTSNKTSFSPAGPVVLGTDLLRLHTANANDWTNIMVDLLVRLQ
jgi:hypothetical protein